MATANFYATGSALDQWTTDPTSALRVDASRSVDSIRVYPQASDPYDGAIRIQLFNSTEARPAGLASGSTVTAVKLRTTTSREPGGHSTRAYTGSFYPRAIIGGAGATGSAVGGGSTDAITLPRPGGGTWTYADFDSSLYWGFKHVADATEAYADTTYFDQLYLEVTYTPASPPPAPTAAFSASTTTGAAPLTVNFTDSSSNTPTSWTWAFGDTSTSTSQHPSHAYSAAATYTVTLTAANASGTDSEVKASYINVLAATTTPVAAFTAAPRSGVQNLAVQFYNGSTGTPAPTSWTWNFGDTTTSTSQNPSHVYTTIGTYTVTLTASNTTPASDAETKTSYITVASGAPVPVISLSTTTGAKPLTVIMTGTATNASGATWNWNFGDGETSQAQHPIHIYTTVGTYTVTLTASNVISSASTTAGPITVIWATPTASFTAEPLQGYSPLTVRFRDLSSGDANGWAWSFGDSTTSSEQHPVHTYTSTAGLNATVTLAVRSLSTNDGQYTSITTSTNLVCVVAPNNSWGLFLYELKHQLLEPTYAQNLTQGFDAFGGGAWPAGINQVVRLTQQRLKKFVLQTAALRKEVTLGAAFGNSEEYPLPADMVELLRLEVNGVAYRPIDHWQKDKETQLNGYIYPVPQHPLRVTIPGTFGTSPTVKVWYSYSPEDTWPIPTPDCPSQASWVFFPLPYVLWWIIRYGVLADLFSQSGERNDPVRAAKCEEIFKEGVELYNFLYRGSS